MAAKSAALAGGLTWKFPGLPELLPELIRAKHGCECE